MSRLRWEDPPDKTKLMPDEYQGQLAPWSEEGRKRAAKQETKQWSATMDSPIEVEAVAKVCPTFLCRLWGCVCVGWGSCCRCCVRSESVLWLLRLSMGEDGAGDPPPLSFFAATTSFLWDPTLLSTILVHESLPFPYALLLGAVHSRP